MRLNSMLSGYKRKVSNTLLFQNDIGMVDKFIFYMYNNKDYQKSKIRYMDCIEIFDIQSIDLYIREYFFDIFDKEVIDLYEQIYKELIDIQIKQKSQK